MSANHTISKNVADISAIYQAKLDRWPVPYESLFVPTRFGITHAIACGKPDSPPVVLVHAMGVNSTMWQANVSMLSRDYRTYALDTIGDLGRSQLSDMDSYPKNGKAYSDWLGDVCDGLGIESVQVIESSMGGWIAMNFAIHAAGRIERMVLLGPIGLPSWLTTIKVLSQLWSVFLFPSRSNVSKIIQWALGDDPLVQAAFEETMTIGVGNRSRVKMAPPLNLSDDQLRRIGSPTLLILGERDHVIGNAKEVAARAERWIPQVQVEIIPGAGHLMSTEKPAWVNELILNFLLQM